jgi:serine/threonine protein kinase
MSGDEDDNFQYHLFSQQGGAKVDEIAPGVVRKTGDRVTRSEEAALRLVKEHTEVPVPRLISSNYFMKRGRGHGTLLMELADGSPLNSLWDGFDNDTKERICRNLWQVVVRLQQIPRPPAFADLYQIGADGSPTIDVLIRDINETGTPILTDEALRARIYERYLHFNGGSYPESLPDILPRSSTSVFSHGDLTPRNILVDGNGQMTTILDWERAGWYPEYSEFANMMRPSNDWDWMRWMDHTKPVEWDITGIAKARRVLF